MSKPTWASTPSVSPTNASTPTWASTDESVLVCSAEAEANAPLLCKADTRVEQANSDAYLFVCWAFYIVAGVMLLIITIRHLIYVKKDLWSSEPDRREMFTKRCRRTFKTTQLPALDSLYKLLNFTTLLSLVLWTCSLLSGCFAFFSQSDEGCTVVVRFVVVLQVLAENAMYVTHLLRLDRLYKPSPFQCRRKCIWFFAFLLIAFAFAVSLTVAISVDVVRVPWDKGGASGIPNLCVWKDVGPMMVLTAAITVERIIVTIAVYYAYTYPLHKMINFYRSRGDEGIARKIDRSGYKLFILTMVAMFSSIIFLLVCGFTNLAILHIPPIVIDAVCLVFMTSYYPDAIYYRRFCTFCLYLCPWSSWSEHIEDDAAHDSDASCDTGGAVRGYGGQMTFALKNGQGGYDGPSPASAPGQTQMTSIASTSGAGTAQSPTAQAQEMEPDQDE